MRTSIFRTITILLLITSFGSAKSQNYRVLQPERTTMFQSEYGTILGMRVDSITVSGSDSIFYLLKNLQQVDYDCFHIEGPSWMGDRITIRSNGETVFYNVYEQPVLIKTKALLNEEWICYSTPELSFRASITSVGVADILGFPDSVKTVSYQAINFQGQNISHEVNNLNLKLSKNFGILKTINFYSFPELNLGFLLQWLSEFTLIGFDNPETGIQNLTWKAVNDHNIGDELHTSGTTAYAYYYKYTETIEKVLDKTISGDSIIYNWENKVKISIQTPDSNTFTATVDTITQYITSNPEFDILPGVAWQLSSWGDFYNANMMYQGEHGPVKTFGNETNAVEKGTELFMGDTCYTPVIVCGCAADYTYYSGLGGPYYYCNMGIDQYIRELVYYKKDGIEWGTPIDFTVNSNLIPIEQKPELVTVFPNPASDLVNIVFKGNTGEYRLQIVDNSGRKIAEYSLKGEDNSIDLSSFKKGIFLLRILSENLTITKRLVKI